MSSPAHLFKRAPPTLQRKKSLAKRKVSSAMSLSLLLGVAKDIVFALAVLVAVAVVAREGAAGLARKLLLTLRQLHGVDYLISMYLRREVRSFLRQIDPKSFPGDSRKQTVKFPEKGKLTA